MRITSGLLTNKKSLKRKKSSKKNTQVSKTPKPIEREVDERLMELPVLDLNELVEQGHSLRIEDQMVLGKKTRDNLRKEVVLDLIQHFSDLDTLIPKSKFKPNPITKNKNTLCILFSDWHFGKVIKTRSGTQIYNSEIAKERIEKELLTQICEYLITVKDQGEIDQVKILFAGDIVDNDIIYDTQRFAVDSGVAEQFHGVTRSIMKLIGSLREALKLLGHKKAKIELECLTGNHGRAGKVSETPICSWDTAVYSALDLAIRSTGWDDVNVSFSLDDFHVCEARGWRLLMVHHAPPQSETPSAKKKFGGLYEIFDYDLMVYGDLHHKAFSAYNGKPLIMNGSLCGYDDYAINLGVRDDWSQTMWLANDQRPVNYLHWAERQ